MSTPNDSIFLQLYDVITINSPSNQNYHEKQFKIEYIDATKIKMVSVLSNKIFTLLLNPDKTLQDESILYISSITRGDIVGYAKQHNLLPNKWIDITFGGNLPVVITGQITNLEEDMIEIKLYNSEDIIYIDFAYIGLPEELNIEHIKIRADPNLSKDGITPPTTEDEEQAVEQIQKTPEELEQEEEDFNLHGITPTPDNAEHVDKSIQDASEVVFGPMIGEISQLEEVDKKKQRYGIDTQTNSLLDELLADIPTSQRSEQVMNSLNQMIQRYIQLRNQFSTFDDYGNAMMPKKKTAAHRPLISHLIHFKNKIPSILPIINVQNKFYTERENNEDLRELTEIFENYKKNNTSTDNNKYKYFLRSIDEFLTPYTIPSNSQSAFQSLQIHQDMDAIVRSLELDDYDDTYTVQRRNLDPRLTIQRMLNNERIQINGVMFFSKPTIENSKQYLPGTSIYDRSSLNQYGFFNKFKIGITQKITIDDLEEPVDYNSINKFMKSNIQLQLAEGVEDIRTYDKFLNAIIPTTKKLFEYTKEYNTTHMTLKSLVSELEPYCVYIDDITYKLYEDMIQALNQRIIEYKKKYKENQKTFQLVAQNINKHIRPSSGFLSTTDLLKDSNHPINKQDLYEDTIIQSYFLNANTLKTKTNSETLRLIYALDKGRLFSSAVVLSNLHLIETTNLQDELNKGSQQYSEYIEKEKQSDKCGQLVLSKKYIELDELLEDNNKNIFFDKSYDQTQYDFISQYKDEEDTYEPDEFKLFLVKKLMEKKGLKEEPAEIEVEAMISHKRPVRENDYAILDETGKTPKYYKRTSNKWIINESIDGVDITDKMFCNVQDTCFTINEECMDLKVTESVMKNQSLTKLLKAFDLNHELSLEDLTNTLISNYAYYKNQLVKIRSLNQVINYKYNNERYNLGLELNEYELVNMISPYAETLEYILGQPDFVKKQNDIIKFTREFTREALPTESPYWFYCTSTNTKLLPTFLHLLAVTYVENGDYAGVLEKIRKTRGKQSDDQNYWVDQHSGRKISNIDFADDAGLIEAGAKVSVNDLLDEEHKISIDDLENLQDMIEDPVALMVYKIINALTTFMYINLEEHYVPIIQHVLNLFTRKLISEEEHKKREVAAAKKGKTIKSYEDIKNYLLIVIAASYLHIYIQTSVPSIKTKKSFPGCIKSFEGFPLDGSTNIEGITYISCVILNIKAKSVPPWNSMSGIKPDILASTLRDLIETEIIRDVSIEQMYTKKREYIAVGGYNIDIPSEHDVTNWNNFMPPLIDFKMKTLQTVGPSFIKSVVEKMKSGAAHQDDDVLIIRSKIIGFSLQIIEKINKLVKKQSGLLKNKSGDSFLENACCMETSVLRPTIEYFINEDKTIEQDISVVNEYINLIADIHEIPMAPIYLYDTSTKLVFPPISKAFSEQVIYKYFIQLCNFSNDMPLTRELQRICANKPQDFPKSVTFKEQVQYLKDHNMNYNETSLDQLLSIVNKKNTIKYERDEEPISRIQKIRDMLVYLKDSDDTSIPMELRELLNNLIDTFDVGVKQETPEMEAIKNYLAKENSKMKDDINRFLITHGKQTSREISPIITFVNESTSWNVLRTEPVIISNRNIEHDSAYRILDFTLDCINNMCYIYPNIILHKTEHTNVKIHKHWGFSADHNADLKSMIVNYYSFLPQFYNDDFNNILETVQEDCKNIYLLCSIIPCFSPINIPLSDQKILSIFDKTTSTFLYEYCMLKVYLYYINRTTRIKKTQPPTKRFSDVTTDGELADIYTGNYGDEEDIVAGEKLEQSEKVAKLLIEMTKRFITNKSNINMSYEDIMKKINRSAEREKTDKTTRLKSFTDEQRDINTLFRSHKLGEWGKGLQKGLTQYVKETYDEERSEILNRNMNMEERLQVGKFDMNTYFIDEAAQEFIRSQEIEDAEASLLFLAEDDDFGENDGDEGY